MGVSSGDEDGGGVDGDGSGGTSPSRQRAGTETSVPRNLSSMAAALRNPFWNMTGYFRVFASGAIYRRKDDGQSLRRWAPHATARQGVGRAGLWGGAHGPPLDWPFWLRGRAGKIGTSQFVSSNSEDICRTAFLKPKTAENRNWHCGILLIG